MFKKVLFSELIKEIRGANTWEIKEREKAYSIDSRAGKVVISSHYDPEAPSKTIYLLSLYTGTKAFKVYNSEAIPKSKAAILMNLYKKTEERIKRFKGSKKTKLKRLESAFTS